MIYFSEEFECGSYESGKWVYTKSKDRSFNNAFIRQDGRVKVMGGLSFVNYTSDHANTSDVIKIGVESVPGYNLVNITKY